MNTNIIAALLLAASAGASANSLVVTNVTTATKGSETTSISLDLVSSGTASAVDFQIDTGIRGNDAAFDLSACLQGIKGRAGKCAVENGVIFGGFFSANQDALAKGSVSLGRVTIRAKGVTLKSTFEAVNFFGKPVESSVSVN